MKTTVEKGHAIFCVLRALKAALKGAYALNNLDPKKESLTRYSLHFWLAG